MPAHVVFRTEPLPRNATGKVLKRELRDQSRRSEAVNTQVRAEGRRWESASDSHLAAVDVVDVITRADGQVPRLSGEPG